MMFSGTHLIISWFLTKTDPGRGVSTMNRSSALDLKSPLERGDRLRWGVWTLFEARPASIRLAELYWMYSLFTSLVGLCNMFLPGTNIRSLGIISRQRPLQFSKTCTPSATSWPSSLKGGLKIKIIWS